jgi:hypothetical protein
MFNSVIAILAFNSNRNLLQLTNVKGLMIRWTSKVNASVIIEITNKWDGKI